MRSPFLGDWPSCKLLARRQPAQTRDPKTSACWWLSRRLDCSGLKKVEQGALGAALTGAVCCPAPVTFGKVAPLTLVSKERRGDSEHVCLTQEANARPSYSALLEYFSHRYAGTKLKPFNSVKRGKKRMNSCHDQSCRVYKRWEGVMPTGCPHSSLASRLFLESNFKEGRNHDVPKILLNRLLWHLCIPFS